MRQPNIFLQLLLDKSGCLFFESLTSTAISQNNFIYGDLTRIWYIPPKLFVSCQLAFSCANKGSRGREIRIYILFYFCHFRRRVRQTPNRGGELAALLWQPSIGRQFYGWKYSEVGHYVSAMNQDLQAKGVKIDQDHNMLCN